MFSPSITPDYNIIASDKFYNIFKKIIEVKIFVKNIPCIALFSALFIKPVSLDIEGDSAT